VFGKGTEEDSKDSRQDSMGLWQDSRCFFFTVITGRLAMEPTKIPGILDGFPTFGYASLFDFIETIHFYFLWINLNLGNF